MVAEDPGEVLRQLRAYRARQSLAEFVKQAWPVLHPRQAVAWGPHMSAMCDHIQAVLLDVVAVRNGHKAVMEVQNLLINIPPRSGKSMILGVFAPVWIWLHDPTLKIRYVTGNEKVRKDCSRQSRDVLESEWFKDTFRVDWEIRADQDAVEQWANTARGERQFNTFQSRITGLGGDIILIDDPHDAGDVTSDLKRQDVLDRWRDAIDSRINDRRACAKIGIMQRLHEQDWSGFVLDYFRHLRIPMEYEAPSNPPACPCRDCVAGESFLGWRDWRTEPGELMQPERFTRADVEETRARLGSYGFAGQMQQRPAPEGGGIFKKAWFQYYETLPDMLDDVIISCDLANKITTTGSFNVLMVVGKKGPWRYILDVQRNRGEWTTTDIQNRIRDLQTEWSKKTRRMVKILVEDKAVGPTVIQALVTELKLQGVIQDDEAQKARDDKVSRAMAVQPQVEGKNVSLPVGAPWVGPLLHELCTFPASANDDQVDTFTMGLNYWRGSADAERARWKR